MNLIKLQFAGETWYHAKKRLSSGNSLRLTREISESQTYNNPGSAMRGITTLTQDIWLKARFKEDNDPYPVGDIIRFKRSGGTLQVEIVEAQITEGPITQTVQL